MKDLQNDIEMRKVMDALMEALPAGKDYIADNIDQYFNVALPVFDFFNEKYNLTLKRIPPGVEEETPDGKNLYY
jgi:hypothetical protein